MAASWQQTFSDCVMISYNKNYTTERPVIETVRGAKGKAVLVKKGLRRPRRRRQQRPRTHSLSSSALPASPL